MRAGKTFVIAGAALLAAFAADAAVVRKLPDMTVVESETVATDALKATSVRSSNDSVFIAALRESGEAVVSGVRLGEAQLSYVDERGVYAARTVWAARPRTSTRCAASRPRRRSTRPAS